VRITLIRSLVIVILVLVVGIGVAAQTPPGRRAGRTGAGGGRVVVAGWTWTGGADGGHLFGMVRRR
jgi:hypothetical protein